MVLSRYFNHGLNGQLCPDYFLKGPRIFFWKPLIRGCRSGPALPPSGPVGPAPVGPPFYMSNCRVKNAAIGIPPPPPPPPPPLSRAPPPPPARPPFPPPPTPLYPSRHSRGECRPSHRRRGHASRPRRRTEHGRSPVQPRPHVSSVAMLLVVPTRFANLGKDLTNSGAS